MSSVHGTRSRLAGTVTYRPDRAAQDGMGMVCGAIRMGAYCALAFVLIPKLGPVARLVHPLDRVGGGLLRTPLAVPAISERIGGGGVRLDIQEMRSTSTKELGIRFVFGFAIAVVAGFLGQHLGPLVGGLFLAFPAILPAALTLVAEKEGEKRAEVNALGAILGTIGLACSGLLVAVALGRYPSALAIPMATGAWLVTAFGLHAVVEQGIAMSLGGDPGRRRR